MAMLAAGVVMLTMAATAEQPLIVGVVAVARADAPGFGSAPNGGQFPVGWGNGDCWVAKFKFDFCDATIKAPALAPAAQSTGSGR